MSASLTPLKLVPAYKDYLWGGTRLKTEFGKESPLEKLAESWELSCHPDGHSTIANGPFGGKTLKDYIDSQGIKALGVNCERFKDFPLLIKLIDARERLSVQVHPSDATSLKEKGESGKTEVWIVLDCQPGASLIYGFQRELTKEEFKSRIADNTLLEVVKPVPVKKGDVFFIEAGTLHAIGDGIVIGEIQQNSNTTFRVYDYGRRDKEGKLRDLHLDRAVEVTDLKPTPPSKHWPIETHDKWDVQVVAHCPYFHVERVNMAGGKAELSVDDSSFKHILVTEGAGTLEAGESFSFSKGDSFFLPAAMGDFSLSGNCQLLITNC